MGSQPSAEAQVELILGVDMGGSGIRVALADAGGSVRARTRGGPGNPVRIGAPQAAGNLRGALEEALQGIEGPRIGACCIGMAGVSHPSAKGVVRAAFHGLPEPARRILCDDLTIALDAAFEDGGGIVVLSGTGSGALARNGMESRRVGGHGPMLGDEGSGHGLALAALRAVVRALDARGEETALTERLLRTLEVANARQIALLLGQGQVDVPGLFPIVEQTAREGDAVARAVLVQGGRDLAELARAAARLVGAPEGTKVATAGSVIGGSLILRDALMDALRSESPAFAPGPHVESAVDGALWRARLALASASAAGPDW